MTQVPSPVLQAISEILAAQSPQFAARLKQRLTAALQAKEEPAFDERKFGFKGFRDFLERGSQGLFSVEPSAVGSDVMVSLAGVKNHSIPATPTTDGGSHSIRNDVWQAFTNPDAARVRFWGRRTFQVRHYLRGEDSPHAREVQDSPGNFIEINLVRLLKEVTHLLGSSQLLCIWANTNKYGTRQNVWLFRARSYFNHSNGFTGYLNQIQRTL